VNFWEVEVEKDHFKRRRKAARKVLELMDKDFIGYNEYVVIIRLLMFSRMVEIATGLFPRCVEYARHDYGLLVMAVDSSHVSSVQWVLSKLGLGFSNIKPRSLHEKTEYIEATRYLVFTACKNYRRGGLAVAKYLVSKRFKTAYRPPLMIQLKRCCDDPTKDFITEHFVESQKDSRQVQSMKLLEGISAHPK
jgi:hypothetical protein